MSFRIKCPRCKGNIRYCPGCKKYTIWNFDKAIKHGRCGKCGGVHVAKKGKLNI